MMIECKKVINNLEYHIHLLYDVIPHVSRDDGEYLEATAKTMSDAIILLKAQEAIKPSTYHHLFICPVCKNTLFEGQKFCHECGQAVKWDE